MSTRKYKQIVSSINEVGLIEPLSVIQPDPKKSEFLLLDGHLRVLALKELGMEDDISEEEAAKAKDMFEKMQPAQAKNTQPKPEEKKELKKSSMNMQKKSHSTQSWYLIHGVIYKLQEQF